MPVPIPASWQSDNSGIRLSSSNVGGPIQQFARPRTLEDMRDDIRIAQEMDLSVHVMGAGSNLLFADEGLDGLLIQPAFTKITIVNTDEANQYIPLLKEITDTALINRYVVGASPDSLQLTHSRQTEEGEQVFVEMQAGVPWGQAVAFSLKEGLSGLQWYARIPCQVGGAVFNNIHGEKHLLSEVICAVIALNLKTLEEEVLTPAQLDFNYDYSIFHKGNYIILAVVFALQKVGVEQAKVNQAQYLDWTKQKVSIQPSGANCGSVFQNLSSDQAAKNNQVAVAAAWYIDQCGLKGYSIRAMQVYPGHANFIINTGQGTQADFIFLVQYIRLSVWKKFGFLLEPEVECWDRQGNRKAWLAIPA